MARKAAIESDIDKGYRRVPQQFSSSFQLQIEQVMVWAVPRRCSEHPDEMDTAIAGLVRQSLQTQITTEAPHALDYPSQHVSRQSGRAPIVGLRPGLSSVVEHSHDPRLRKILRVQPFACKALGRIGNKKRHELLSGRVLKGYLQTQLSLRAVLQFRIQGAHQFGVQCA